MIPTELKNIEMKLDRQKLEEHKNKEQYTRDKLEKMQPLVPYRVPWCINSICVVNECIDVEVGPKYKQSKGEKSQEEIN